MSFLVRIRRRDAFLITWFIVFLAGLGLAPEISFPVLVVISFAYGVTVFLPAFTFVWLLRRGGGGVLLAISLVVAILVASVVVGTFAYQFRDTRNLPKDLFIAGASYLTGMISGGRTSPQVTPTTATAGIDVGWVQQFMGVVNAMRSEVGVSPLVQNSTLDEFARVRAATSMAHYGTSHYGRDHDFSCFFLNCIPSSELSQGYYVYNQTALNSLLGSGAYYQQPVTNGYWQLALSCANCTSRTVYFVSQQAVAKYFRLTYGHYTDLSFMAGNVITVSYPPEPTEEILYPYGPPSSYAVFLQQVATAHWSGFLDGTLQSYGFHLEPGVALIPLGQCPVTEIPGPNIDIGEFYAQHGCSFDYGLTEWLVLELGK